MGRTTLTAPAHVIPQRSPVGVAGVQPDQAPSLCFGGGGILDHRMSRNQGGAGFGSLATACGWAMDGTICALDQAIANAPAGGTGGIAPAANVTSGTAMTLTTATTLTNGALVTPSALTTFPFGTVIPAGTVVIQSQMAYLSLGLRDKTAFYDPTNTCARVIAVTGVAGGTGGHFIISGWDIYGQPMTEDINATAGATTTNGKKAWKWIKSITPQFTDAHNYSFDVLNIFGLAMAADTAAYVDAWIAGTGFQTNPTVTAADATSPATTTTGDVRGTISLTPGGNRITLFVSPSTARLCAVSNTINVPSIFGVTNT